MIIIYLLKKESLKRKILEKFWFWNWIFHFQMRHIGTSNYRPSYPKNLNFFISLLVQFYRKYRIHLLEMILFHSSLSWHLLLPSMKVQQISLGPPLHLLPIFFFVSYLEFQHYKLISLFLYFFRNAISKEHIDKEYLLIIQIYSYFIASMSVDRWF